MHSDSTLTIRLALFNFDLAYPLGTNLLFPFSRTTGMVRGFPQILRTSSDLKQCLLAQGGL